MTALILHPENEHVSWSQRLLRSTRLYGTAAGLSMLLAIVVIYAWRAAVEYPLIVILAAPVVMVAGLVVMNYYFVRDILRKQGAQLPFAIRIYIALVMVFPLMLRFFHPDFTREQTNFLDELMHSKAR